MNREKQGFVPILIVLIIAILGIAGYWAYKNYLPHWVEYTPKCQALANNVRIFFPNGWVVGNEEPISDAIGAQPGTKELEDFHNLVSECLVSAAGRGGTPGSHQQRCGSGNGVVIYISARVDEGQDSIDYLKNYYSDKSLFPDIDSVGESVFNGQKYLTVLYNNKITEYRTWHNGYEITISPAACSYQPDTETSNYIEQTGIDVFKRLIFK